MTTFYHAKKNNINLFWNVDADDTMFLLNSDISAEILRQAEQYSQKASIDLFSLDMHRSEMHNKHWSFGITYTVNPTKWLNLFDKNKNNDWHKKYCYYDSNSNLDWYCTYLKDTNCKSQIATFAVNNLMFAHWANINTPFFGYSIYHWMNGSLTWVFLDKFYPESNLSSIPISDEVMMLPVNISDTNWQDFVSKKIYNISFLDNYNRKLSNERTR